MHIGMIGGIGPAATDLYYRGLIRAMKARGAPLKLTIVHADAETLVRNFEAKAADAQALIYRRLADRMVAAGAGAMAISSIGGHFCIEEFRKISPLPIIDMITEMNAHLVQSGLKRVGMLGTDAAMETRFYGGVDAVEMLIPPPDVIREVHRAYVDMAISGDVTETGRQIFFEAGRAMAAEGAEVVLLGGTDLFLAFDGQDPGFETLDCAEVHVEAIARVASGG